MLYKLLPFIYFYNVPKKAVKKDKKPLHGILVYYNIRVGKGHSILCVKSSEYGQ